jgi:hypothetical protein
MPLASIPTSCTLPVASLRQLVYVIVDLCTIKDSARPRHLPPPQRLILLFPLSQRIWLHLWDRCTQSGQAPLAASSRSLAAAPGALAAQFQLAALQPAMTTHATVAFVFPPEGTSYSSEFFQTVMHQAHTPLYGQAGPAMLTGAHQSLASSGLSSGVPTVQPHAASSHFDADSLDVDVGSKVVCGQCGVLSFPHNICRCRTCGERHTHVPGCIAAVCSQCGKLLKPHVRCLCRRCGRTHRHNAPCIMISGISNVTTDTYSLNVDVRSKVICGQCGVLAFPHSMCRCLTCGDRHSHVSGCIAVECSQCGEMLKPHLRCQCRRCGRTHHHNDPCYSGRASLLRSSSSRLRAAMNGCVPDVHSVGLCDQVCPHCHSRSWRNESINCCAAGAIVLPSFPDVPVEMANLILTPHVRSNIRKYNMAMAMASVGHQNISLPDGMFTLGGKSFHRIGSLRPVDASPPAFAQIYTLDTEEASNRRIRALGGRDVDDPLRPAILSQMHSWMLLHNPWVRQFVAASHSGSHQLVWRSSDDIAAMQLGALVAQPGSKRDIVIERQVRRTAC